MKWIIGGAAVAAILMIALVGGAAVFIFSGGDSEPVVADATESARPAAAVATETAADDAEDLEDAFRAAEAETELPIPAATDAAAVADASSEEVNAAEAAVATPAPAVEPPAVEPPAAESPTPETTTATVEPAASPASTDSPPVAELAANETEPPKDEPKAAAPKPAQPAAPARDPKWDKPFAALPKSVDLPPLDENAKSEPFELGPLTSDPSEFVRITLIGGEKAFKGKGIFELQNAENGTAERDWEIRFSGASETSPVVATLSLRDDKLFFQWTEAGIAEPLASNLRNCMLHMEVSQVEHGLVLRNIVAVEPITFGLKKAMPVAKINLDMPPDPDQLKIEFLKLDGPFPKFTSDPNQPISATNGTQSITFGEKPEEQMLFVRIDSSWKGRGIELKMSPYLRVPGVAAPQRFIAGKLPQMKQAVQGQMNLALAQLNQVMEMEKRVKDPQQRSRLGLAAKKQLAEQAQQQTIEMQNQVDKLEQLVEAVGDGGQLHYRVFYDVDGTQVDLARTDVATPP